MVFNVLVDKTAHWRFPGNSQVIICADNVLVQCGSPAPLGVALRQLSAWCVQVGLAITETNAKVQANGGEFVAAQQ